MPFALSVRNFAFSFFCSTLYALMNIHAVVEKALPGKRAQLEMAPRHRIASLMEAIPRDAVNAAVLVLLTPVNKGIDRKELLDWQVLLIRRTSYAGAHSGQIAFPGGKPEPGDAGLWDTACREAYEEVGVERSAFSKVSPLTSVYVTPSNFVIYPFIALTSSVCALHANPREVLDYKNIPIRVFDPAASTLLRFTYQDGVQREAPAWHYEEYTIWGATAMILAELYRLIDEEILVCS